MHTNQSPKGVRQHRTLLSNLSLIWLMALTVGLLGCQTPAPREMGQKTQQPEPMESQVHRFDVVPNGPKPKTVVVQQSDQGTAQESMTNNATPPADLWHRLRSGFGIQPVGGRAAQIQLQHERWYRDRPEHIRRVFTRARLYMFDIVEAVEQAQLPMEVALLPAVESAFQPAAVSSAAADGLWQFIAPTGRRYDLKQHLFLDERRDVRAATKAAMRYLQDLRIRYNGDMQLALAAYNCGEGCIDAQIRRAQSKGLPGRFEDLQLNRETANYVPRLLALSKLVAHAVDLNKFDDLGLPAMANAPYFAPVPIYRDLDIVLAARLAGMRLDDFKALNSQHKKPVIVAAGGVQLLVPVERVAPFLEAMAGHRGPMASWSAVSVHKSASPTALAQQYGTDVTTLLSVNRIATGHVIKAGSTVLVPRGQRLDDISKLTMEAAVLQTMPAMTVHKVKLRKGESWQEIVDKLKRQGIAVTTAELRAWNPKMTKLKAGIVSLKVPVIGGMSGALRQLQWVASIQYPVGKALPDVHGAAQNLAKFSNSEGVSA